MEIKRGNAWSVLGIVMSEYSDDDIACRVCVSIIHIFISSINKYK